MIVRKEIKYKRLGTTVLFLSLPWVIVDYFLPAYAKKELAATALDIGMYLALFSFTMAVFRPLIGSMVDRYGRKRFIVIGSLLYLLGILFYGFALNLSFLMIAAAFHGLGAAFFWVPAYAMISDLSKPQERGKAYGFIEGMANKGLFIGAGMGFFLIPFLEGLFRPLGLSNPFDNAWRITFIVYALFSIYAFLSAFRLKEPEIAPYDPQKAQISPIFLVFLLIIFLTAFASTLLAPIIIIYMLDRFDLTVWQLALAYIPAAVVYAIFPPYTGRLSDKIGHKNGITIGLAASSITFFIIPLAPTLYFLILFWVMEAIALTIAKPAQQALVATLGGEDRRGRGYGYYTMAFCLGATLGPLIGGWLYDQFSSFYPFSLSGILLLGGALVTLSLKIKR